MSRIHHSIINLWNQLSIEKKLACKITGASFIVLLFIIGTIILSSLFYQMDRAYSDFRIQTQNITRFDSFFENERIDVEDFFSFEKLNIQRQRDGRRGGPPGRGEVIIFDKANTIIKNDILDLDENEKNILIHLPLQKIQKIEFDDNMYLIYKSKSPLGSVYLLSDIEPLLMFHARLLLLAALGSIFGLILIFFLSLYLANLSITPIKEHNASLEAYNRNVSHELRTPLSVMRSNLELLTLTQSPRLIESSKEEVISMERIIETLLFLSNPHGKVDLSESIDPAIEIYTLLDGYDTSLISLDIEKKATQLKGNIELFHRVLVNLLDNAFKYKTTGKVKITYHKKMLQISNIIDKDMTAEVIEKLTDAFYQGDISRHDSGYGLGLSLVKKICDISGWKISILSTDNNFTVKIHFS